MELTDRLTSAHIRQLARSHTVHSRRRVRLKWKTRPNTGDQARPFTTGGGLRPTGRHATRSCP